MGGTLTALIVAVVAAVVFGVLGFVLGQAHRKKTAESLIGSANDEAARIVNNAVNEAETKKKEAILEAKDEIHKFRSESEREIRERRNEVQRQEKRLIQKEESLDKKLDNLEKSVLNNRICKSCGNIRNTRAFLLRLLNVGVHKNSASCAKVNRIFGKKSLLCKFRRRVTKRTCKILNKRTAT